MSRPRVPWREVGEPDEIEPLVEALLAGDTGRGERYVGRGPDARGSLLTVIDDAIPPAMARIGVDWEPGEVSVAEEHLVTATIRTVVAQRLAELPPDLQTDRTVLLACVEENEHELDLRVLSDAFELSGWSVRFLGANVPTEALVATVDRWRPDVLALSVSMDRHVRTARDSIQAIRELGPPQPTILVGGSVALPERVHLEETGAEAWATSIQDGIEAAKA